MKATKANKADRLTVTLGPGQRGELVEIAKRNNTTIAFVVRYALSYLIRNNKRQQLMLDF